jgi:DNA-binding transcriptional MerR regulator
VTRSRTFKVSDVARLAGVSIRALHHYDAIGLLVPAVRTAAGYRVYTDADLLRLQQILIGRELGLSLEEIRRSLDDPGFDWTAALLDATGTLERAHAAGRGHDPRGRMRRWPPLTAARKTER